MTSGVWLARLNFPAPHFLPPFGPPLNVGKRICRASRRCGLQYWPVMPAIHLAIRTVNIVNHLFDLGEVNDSFLD